MSLNIAILPKRHRRDIAVQKTRDSIAGISNVLDKIRGTPDRFQVESSTAPEEVKSLRRSLAAYKAEPISRNWRLIWSQDEETKSIQHRWAKRIGKVRGHQGSWGFRKGRSCHDCCQAHLVYWGIKKPGELNFVSMDVENFFPSITGSMIDDAMQAHGFSSDDIDECIDICTMKMNNDMLWDVVIERLAKGTDSDSSLVGGTSLSGLFGEPGKRTTAHEMVSSIISLGIHRGKLMHPDTIAFVRELVFRYICGFGRDTQMGDRILIQGSPASPALSNLVAKRIDYRLEALAKARGAFYSRYADDVTFSWRTRRGKKWIGLLAYSAGKVLSQHGFHIRADKTIIKGPGMRQSMLGYNLNSGEITISRARRHRVSKELKSLASGQFTARGDRLESLMGEVEFIATAHPEVADGMRALGREAMVRAGTMGRACLHFDGENVEPPSHAPEESRPIQLW